MHGAGKGCCCRGKKWGENGLFFSLHLFLSLHPRSSLADCCHALARAQSEKRGERGSWGERKARWFLSLCSSRSCLLLGLASKLFLQLSLFSFFFPLRFLFRARALSSSPLATSYISFSVPLADFTHSHRSSLVSRAFFYSTLSCRCRRLPVARLPMSLAFACLSPLSRCFLAGFVRHRRRSRTSFFLFQSGSTSSSIALLSRAALPYQFP